MGVAGFLEPEESSITDPPMRRSRKLDLGIGQVQLQDLSLLRWTWTHLLLGSKKVSQGGLAIVVSLKEAQFSSEVFISIYSKLN